MPIINWSDDYSINIKEIDEQHKYFLQLVNNFYDSLQDEIDHEAMPFLLNELIDYTRTHFSKEEELMKKYQFPDYEAHKAEHDNFAEKVLDMRKRYDCGDKSIVGKLSLLISDWLTNHIATDDKKYGEYLNSKGVH